MNVNRNFSKVKSKKTFIDKAKTIAAIRVKYGSVLECFQQTNVNRGSFTGRSMVTGNQGNPQPELENSQAF